MKKCITFLLFSLAAGLFLIGSASAQGGYPSRSVFVCDLAVALPAPFANPDSVRNYFHAVKLATALSTHLSTIDPSHDKLHVQVFSPFSELTEAEALADPKQLADLALGVRTAPAADGSVPDYFLRGTVTPVSNGASFAVDLDLVTGATQEVVASGHGSLGASGAGDPAAAAASAMTQLQPAFDKINSFETEKRNSGELFALFPTLTLKASKPNLDFHESAILHVTLTDCDGTPLKNRTVTFTASGGTLDRYSVVTDNLGTQDLVFTAGTDPGIAVIQPSYAYTRSCGKAGQNIYEPLGIQIKKPADAWYIEARSMWSESDEEEGHSEMGPISGKTALDGSSSTEITMFAWMKATPIPYLPDAFINAPEPVSMKLGGGFYDVVNSRSSGVVGSVGTSASEWGHNFSGEIMNTAVPDVSISIDGDTYSIDCVVEALQNGMSYESRDDWDIISGHTHSASSDPADPTAVIGFSVNEATRDTAYTTSTSSPSGTKDIASVTQKVSWKDKVFKLDYNAHYVSTTVVDEAGGSSNKSRVQDHTITVYMYYNTPPTAVAAASGIALPTHFALEQNYPNPFNPGTTIRYSLPEPSRVSITVYDIVGREAAVLVDGDMPAGYHDVSFDAGRLSSGVYIYTITARSGTSTFASSKKLIVVK